MINEFHLNFEIVKLFIFIFYSLLLSILFLLHHYCYFTIKAKKTHPTSTFPYVILITEIIKNHPVEMVDIVVSLSDIMM